MLVRLPGDVEPASRRATLIRVDRIVKGRAPRIEQVGAHVQPSEQLHVPERAKRVTGFEAVTGPWLASLSMLNAQKALAVEVEGTPDRDEVFVARLKPIAAVPADEQLMDANQSDALDPLRIEIHLTVRKRVRETGAAVERGVHLKILVVVLDLGSHLHASRVVGIGNLRCGAP